jgi:hypothetical protein
MNEFYSNAGTSNVVSFWALLSFSMAVSFWFFSHLLHVWVLEFFADQLRISSIVVAFDTAEDSAFWKGTIVDKANVIFVVGLVVFLFIQEQTSAAVAQREPELWVCCRGQTEIIGHGGGC